MRIDGVNIKLGVELHCYIRNSTLYMAIYMAMALTISDQCLPGFVNVQSQTGSASTRMMCGDFDR